MLATPRPCRTARPTSGAKPKSQTRARAQRIVARQHSHFTASASELDTRIALLPRSDNVYVPAHVRPHSLPCHETARASGTVARGVAVRETRALEPRRLPGPSARHARAPPANPREPIVIPMGKHSAQATGPASVLKLTARCLAAIPNANANVSVQAPKRCVRLPARILPVRR